MKMKKAGLRLCLGLSIAKYQGLEEGRVSRCFQIAKTLNVPFPISRLIMSYSWTLEMIMENVGRLSILLKTKLIVLLRA